MNLLSESTRSALNALDWGEPCFVIGHKSPDTDAVCSAIAYSRLMQELGHPCQAALCGPVNRETRFIAQFWHLPVPEILTSVEPGNRLILVDHSEYEQSVDGASQATVLQVIDHHGTGNICEPGQVYVRIMPLGATCTIVYLAYCELGVPVSGETARFLLAGLLSDTRNLQKKTTTATDRSVWEALTRQLGYSAAEVDFVYRRMSEAGKDMTGMTDKEIYLSYFKEYHIGQVRLGISSLDASATLAKASFIDRILAVMPDILAETGDAMLLANVLTEEGSYILYCGEGAETLVEQAFGPSLRKGVCHVPERLSRKTQIVPRLTEILKQK